ncbi:MAG: glycosyltransferase, partial [Acetatifactor sp.]
IHYDVKDMAALMADCDLAITAGGTTIYELSVIGVPFICFSYAENQEALTEYIGRRQIAGFAGACHRETLVTIGRIRQLFMEYSTQMEKRNMCYEKERALIDGFGANRLAQLIWEEA